MLAIARGVVLTMLPARGAGPAETESFQTSDYTMERPRTAGENQRRPVLLSASNDRPQVGRGPTPCRRLLGVVETGAVQDGSLTVVNAASLMLTVVRQVACLSLRSVGGGAALDSSALVVTSRSGCH